jgi:outer membrane lipoprotein-sorting protein
MFDALLAALLASVASAGAPAVDAAALLSRAERLRASLPEGVLTIRVTSSTPGEPEKSGTFELAMKGPHKSRLKFLGPGDEGKYVVSVGDEVWLLLPTAKNPIRVPASHRIRGGLSVADLARMSFAGDYDAVVEREDVLDGRRCAVLRLVARKGATVSYPVVRVWIDENEGLYRKAVFLVASGRTAREVSYDAYEMRKGLLVVGRMTVTDVLRPGTTVVEYVDFDRRPVPDAWFDPKTARGD